MARKSSAEIAAESMELKDVALAEKELNAALKQAKLEPGMDWMVSQIALIIDKERMLNHLVVEELSADRRLAHLDQLLPKFAGGEMAKKISVEIYHLESSLKAMGKEIAALEKEIIARERLLLEKTKMDSSHYQLYKDLVKAGEITVQDLKKFGAFAD
jgi:hypothetical protein